MKPPTVKPDSDWDEIDLPFEIGSGRSMFVETPDGPTIRMRFFKRRADGALVGHVWFGSATVGPPGFAHGGLISFVLDEAMGSCGWLGGYPCVAANLGVDFVAMTPLGEDCFIESKIVDVTPKKLIVEASLSLESRLLVTGRGVFARLKKERLGSMVEHVKGSPPDLSGFRFAD